MYLQYKHSGHGNCYDIFLNTVAVLSVLVYIVHMDSSAMGSFICYVSPPVGRQVTKKVSLFGFFLYCRL